MRRGLTVATLAARPALGGCGKSVTETTSFNARILGLGLALVLESEA